MLERLVRKHDQPSQDPHDQDVADEYMTKKEKLEQIHGPSIRPDGEHNEKVCARLNPDPDACVAPLCSLEKRWLAFMEPD